VVREDARRSPCSVCDLSGASRIFASEGVWSESEHGQVRHHEYDLNYNI